MITSTPGERSKLGWKRLVLISAFTSATVITGSGLGVRLQVRTWKSAEILVRSRILRAAAVWGTRTPRRNAAVWGT